MPPGEPTPFTDVLFTFGSIFLEGAPYIFLGTLISGFIDAYLPSNTMDRMLPKRPTIAIMASGLLGAIFPVCECAVVPVIRRLVQKGLPVSCAVTYMLSAPIINPIVIVSTVSAFKGQQAWGMTFSRLGMAYIVTVFVGLLVQQFWGKKILKKSVLEGLDSSDASGDEHAEPTDAGLAKSKADGDRKLRQALRTAQGDFLDTGMYFVIGVLITSIFITQFQYKEGTVDAVQSIAGTAAFSVPIMMVLSSLLSLCSTTDAFIAAQLGGFAMVSKLAFLVYGPMVDVKLIFMYASVFNKKFVIGLVVGLFFAIGLLSLAWQVFLN